MSSAPTLACQRARHATSDAPRNRALRSFFTAGGTESRAAVAVPGRGEYGKTCTFVIPAAAITARVRSKAASVSVGKPTIASVVRLKSSSASSRRRYVLELYGGVIT